MVRSAVNGTANGTAVGDGAVRRVPAPVVPAVPNVDGDFDEVLDHRPVFRVRLHGYDRLEVDNYTAWAESELVAARREVDHLLSRYGEASAQLEISRRLLADAPRGREVFPLSQRLEEMLRLASDEAAALTEQGEREAARIVAEARSEADARLRKAHQIKEMAVATADELREDARRDRATAAAGIERAKVEAADLLRRAAEERARIDESAARARDQAAREAAAHLAAVRAEVDALHRHGDLAREALRGLTDRIGEALEVVADMAPADAPRTHLMRDNVAVEEPAPDRVDEDVAALAGRPAPVPH